MVKIEKQNFKENKKIYNLEKNKLKKELGDNINIFHVGSTAIPDMYGKDIIDILVEAKNECEFKEIKNKLKNLGYYCSEKNVESNYQFFASKKEETTKGDIHIHLAIKDTPRFADFLILKEFLLKNKNEAQKYSEEKLKLINHGINDRKEYKKIKSEYVSNLLKKARENISDYYRIEQ